MGWQASGSSRRVRWPFALMAALGIAFAPLLRRRLSRFLCLRAPSSRRIHLEQARRLLLSDAIQRKLPVPMTLWVAYRSWVDEVILTRDGHDEATFHSFVLAHVLGHAPSPLKSTGSDAAAMHAWLAEARLLGEVGQMASVASAEEALIASLERSRDAFETLMALRSAAASGSVHELMRVLGTAESPRQAVVEQLAAPLPLSGDTVLHVAAREGHAAAMSLLIDRGACVNAPSGGDGSHPVHCVRAAGFQPWRDPSEGSECKIPRTGSRGRDPCAGSRVWDQGPGNRKGAGSSCGIRLWSRVQYWVNVLGAGFTRRRIQAWGPVVGPGCEVPLRSHLPILLTVSIPVAWLHAWIHSWQIPVGLAPRVDPLLAGRTEQSELRSGRPSPRAKGGRARKGHEVGDGSTRGKSPWPAKRLQIGGQTLGSEPAGV